MPILGHVNEKLVDIGIRHVGMKEEDISGMHESEKYQLLKNAYVSPVVLFRTSAVEMDHVVSSETRHLMHACELTPARFKAAWDTHRFFLSHHDVENMKLLNDIAKRQGFEDASEFIDTMAKCQCFISLTYGFRDYYFSVAQKDGKYPLQTLKGMLLLHAKIWRYHNIAFDEETYAFEDMLQIFCRQSASQVLKIGWWF